MILLTIAFVLSAIGTVLVWARLAKQDVSGTEKVLTGLLAIIPIIGPLMGLFTTSAPPPAPENLRATMNHYGNGGRFIGGGSRQFNYDPVASIEPAKQGESNERQT
jgi:hypothetical protein